MSSTIRTAKITLTWKAFGSPTSATFDFPTYIDEAWQLCATAFDNTNKYEGEMWEIIQYFLPADRTHTALSVGDEVTVDGETFRCAPVGWESLVK